MNELQLGEVWRNLGNLDNSLYTKILLGFFTECLGPIWCY